MGRVCAEKEIGVHDEGVAVLNYRFYIVCNTDSSNASL